MPARSLGDEVLQYKIVDPAGTLAASNPALKSFSLFARCFRLETQVVHICPNPECIDGLVVIIAFGSIPAVLPLIERHFTHAQGVCHRAAG